MSNSLAVDLVLADCLFLSDELINIKVQSCENINPSQTAQLRNYQGETFGNRQRFLEHYYRGALITSKSGIRYVYPTQEKNPCLRFPQGQSVKKMVTQVCCDTGAWGKCIFGGAFLYEQGHPINSFQ